MILTSWLESSFRERLDWDSKYFNNTAKPVSVHYDHYNSPTQSPSHYTQHPSGVECLTITRHMNFNRGNAVKYLWRAGLKGEGADKELEDLEKAVVYIKDEIKRLKGE